jgi:hypothetical protein
LVRREADLGAQLTTAEGAIHATVVELPF